jgi:hypothetical protein
MVRKFLDLMSTALLVFLICLAGLMLIAGLIVVALVVAVAWVAVGESDVNGDPERDAGMNLSERTFPTLIQGQGRPVADVVIFHKTRAIGKSFNSLKR